ncbi:MAG: FKBP-type peptidyl-prolyl cis-trans isomerase [Bacteroidales bacterium]|nr:FKBP-type peptidyl-prolyl cis-trans isomerase [Bacteroidales bacterium]
MDKLSYALGMSLGHSLARSGVDKIDFDSLLSGLKAVLTNRTPEISAEEANRILNEYFDKLSREKNGEAIKAADNYLKENATKEGVKVTASGLQYKVISEGTGANPTGRSRVKCHYEGKLSNGQIFDSSYQRGEPAVFGLDQVIPGWTEGLQLMKVGAKYEFTIPPALGYGEAGIEGVIPGNSVLIFVVELLDIV